MEEAAHNSLPLSLSSVGRPLLRLGAALLMGWLLLGGALLAVRMLVHAVHPLGVGEVLVAGVGLAAVAWLTRAAWNNGTSARPRSPSAAVLPSVATSAALLLWGACLTRGVSLPAAAIFWLMFIAEEAWAWRGPLRTFQGDAPPVRRVLASRGDLLLQQFTRLLTPDGDDVVRGTLSVMIDRGGRSAAAHVAFCPPFSERPQFDVQPTAGENAILKVSQLYPHGARIEVKLPQPANADTTVAVHFVARAPRSMLSSG